MQNDMTPPTPGQILAAGRGLIPATLRETETGWYEEIAYGDFPSAYRRAQRNSDADGGTPWEVLQLADGSFVPFTRYRPGTRQMKRPVKADAHAD